MEREYCEQCGAKDSIRSTTLDDYENNRASKLDENYYKINDKPVNGVIDTREPKKFKFGYVILIIISAILIIDLIGFFLIMNILNIPLNEIGNALPILYTLLGFSLIMLILLIICIYMAYYRVKYLSY
ncbi:MAG: hypothetical protein ACFFBH_09960 [Promethearchaeota archaeon]